jgi:hypothetical protein
MYVILLGVLGGIHLCRCGWDYTETDTSESGIGYDYPSAPEGCGGDSTERDGG